MPQSANDDHTAVALLIDRVERLCRLMEGNGTPGVVHKVAANERQLAEVATRQAECPARNRRWTDVILVACAVIAALAAILL